VTEAPPRKTHLRGIEGMRAVAAGTIVLVHVWAFSSPSGTVPGAGDWRGNAISTLSVGVTLFFTLSGFLLYRPFAASIARAVPHMPISTYLRNRFLRIAPAYWTILLLAAVVLGSVGIRNSAGALEVGRLTDPSVLAQAGLLVYDYRPSQLLIGIGPAWSLAVEVVFYLALPILVLAAAALARRFELRRDRILVLLAPALLLLLLGLSGKAVAGIALPADPTAGYDANWHSVIERSFWAQADLFSFGMVVAVLFVEVEDGRFALPERWRWYACGLAAAIFIPCAWTIHQGEQSYLLQNTGEALAIALAFAALVLPAASGPGKERVIGWLEGPFLVAFGIASYSVFLWHVPVTDWLAAHDLMLEGWGGLLVNTAIVGLLVGALSALTYRFVEKPGLRRKRSTQDPGTIGGRSLLAGSPQAPAGQPDAA
jgi:peptidoglycan/LPS O-acetylase OafA/YrhL